VSAEVLAPYPESPVDRDRWILERRGSRDPVDVRRAVASFVELEPGEDGRPQPVAAIFLANRECPWRCLMCDLWKNTLEESPPAGAIPAQIRGALAALPEARGVKLYNSGSFFDPRAIPPEDYPEIAAAVSGFARVIVESHPALVGEACLRFRDMLSGSLEVALGLETIHPEVLPLLNKRMSLAQFEQAASFLRREGIALRVFVLLGLPFLSKPESLDWACRSVEFAFNCGAAAVSIIPTRAGNGALETLERRGEFHRPRIASLEAAIESSLLLRMGRVLADLWNLEEFRQCEACFAGRRERLQAMNLRQTVLPPVSCAACGGES
jgi:radical SAM enzyme (TIGR01210 family)